MRFGVEGGPADGREVLADVDEFGRPKGRIELDGAVYVPRVCGAPPHEDADWHYCLVKPALRL